MQLPKRKSEEWRKLNAKTDNFVTLQALERMKRQLDRLLKLDRPKAIQELQRTQEMGDLSENAGYQDAKWRLRRINGQIISLEDRIAHAVPIMSGVGANGEIRIGSSVTLKTKTSEVTYQILGSSESHPAQGKISHSSPLGSLLLGKKVGEEVLIGQNLYKILQIK